MYLCRIIIFMMVHHFRYIVARMSKILLWCGMVSMLWFAFSCEEFCEEPNRTAIVVYFYDAEEKMIEIKNISITAVELDSTFYPNKDIYGETNVKQVLLPINPIADFMRFTIKNDTLRADTITFHYTRHNGFISSECGCVTYAEIQDEPQRTEHSMTRLDVVNRKINTVSYRQGVFNEENIRIYY